MLEAFVFLECFHLHQNHQDMLSYIFQHILIWHFHEDELVDH